MRHLQLALILSSALLLAACGGAPTPAQPRTPATAPASSKPTVTALTGYTNVSPSQLNAMLAQKDFAFVNVHIPYEGEIEPTDAFIPFDEMDQRLDRLPADKGAKIVLYCRSGHMSAIAATTLAKLGFTNILNLDGGMLAWERAGYKLVTR